MTQDAAGRRRDRAQFFTQTKTPDGFGGYKVAYAFQFERWCDVFWPRAYRAEEATQGRVVAGGRARITVLRDPETALIDHNWRVAILTGAQEQGRVTTVVQEDRGGGEIVLEVDIGGVDGPLDRIE